MPRIVVTRIVEGRGPWACHGRKRVFFLGCGGGGAIEIELKTTHVFFF